MFRFKWKEFPPLKFLFNLFPTTKSKRSTESPWLEGLDKRLASRYGEDAMRPTTYKSDSAFEAEDQLRQLCNEVQDDLNANDRIVVSKERRQNATTSVDLKAWWGQAVATWDPIDGKNVDSIEQGRRPRKAKWFDHQPSSSNDLGRPPS